jgi:geranylgeranyl diphosphate synthase type II
MTFPPSIDLASFLPALSESETRLRAALQDALQSSGSLTRVHLTAAIAQAVELPVWKQRQIGVAVEFFHLASLLLDDLPCMDNAQTRRDRPCTHLVHGESSAILAALGLINRAYTLLFETWIGLDPRVALEANHLVDECLGVAGILRGQSLDLNFAETTQDAETVRDVACLKTGSLLRLCLELPAVMAQVADEERRLLARLANTWGLAYQLADDLKDVLQGDTDAGKTTRRDALLGRPNLALVLGPSAAMEELAERVTSAAEILNQLKARGTRSWSLVAAFHEKLSGRIAPLIKQQAVA